MKRMPSGGYTIIEVMIFLIVSSALLTSVMAVMSGRQERIRFTQSVESFDQKMRDILNDVSTGYYPSANNVVCTSTVANDVQLSTGTAEQGTNAQSKDSGCVFLGKAIELGAPSPMDYSAYTMVAAKNATGLADAGTKLLGMSPNPGIVDRHRLLADVEIKHVISQTDSTRNIKGISVVSEFSQRSVLDNSVSGNAGKVTLYEVIDDFAANAGKASTPGNSRMELATDGLLLCLQQGGNGRKAAIYLGKGGQQLATEVIIDEWPTGPGGCP